MSLKTALAAFWNPEVIAYIDHLNHKLLLALHSYGKSQRPDIL